MVRRQERIADWLKMLDTFLGAIDINDVLRNLGERPAVEELFVFAAENAARTAGEEKRRLLARAAARALVGDVAAVEESLVLLRTVVALDEPHIQLLVRISQAQSKPSGRRTKRPEPSTGLTDEGVNELMPGRPALRLGLLSHLESQGLMARSGAPQERMPANWVVTEYGFVLLEYMAIPAQPLAAQ
jgi:hypothetical protein